MLDPGGGAKVLPILKFDLETGSPSALPQYLLRFLLYFWCWPAVAMAKARALQVLMESLPPGGTTPRRCSTWVWHG